MIPQPVVVICRMTQWKVKIKAQAHIHLRAALIWIKVQDNQGLMDPLDQMFTQAQTHAVQSVIGTNNAGKIKASLKWEVFIFRY